MSATGTTRWVKSISGIGPLEQRFLADAITFEEMRDAVVALLRRRLASRLDPDRATFDSELYEAVEYMAETTTQDMYDDAKTDLYDWADDAGVWLEPYR